MGYGVQGPGPSPLLFTVLLQFVPFLNAEGWMERCSGSLQTATGWSIPWF